MYLFIFPICKKNMCLSLEERELNDNVCCYDMKKTNILDSKNIHIKSAVVITNVSDTVYIVF